VIAFIVYLLNGISDTLLGYPKQGLILLVSALIVAIALLFNKKRYHRVSIVAIYIYMSLTVFYFGSKMSVQTGDYLYYFTLILSLSFVFDFEKDRGTIRALFLFPLVLLLIHTYSSQPIMPKNIIKESIRYKMFVINLFINFLSLGFFIYLTIRNNKTINSLYEQRLKDEHDNGEIIKKTLHEKEILLAELHHRVKNNLAVIVGFLNLKMNGSINDEAKNILLESRNHVNSIALIHNRLYNTGNLSEVNFNSYVEDLVTEIQHSYPELAKSVKVNRSIENIKLDLTLAVPCALILNELLTNCHKHAFKESGKGNININFMVQQNGKRTLTVKDDGSGLTEGYDKQHSLGISIISGLSEQINGECQFYNDRGAGFSLVF
jgi:two-component sensor histidine kinase